MSSSSNCFKRSQAFWYNERLCNSSSKKLVWRDIKVLADFIKLAHGWQGTSRTDILDVAFVLAEIQAHLIF